MRSQIWIFFLIIAVFVVLIDLYIYRGISNLSQGINNRASFIIKTVHFGITLAGLVFLTWIFLNRDKYSYEEFFRLLTSYFGFFILVYVPKLLFILFLLIKDVSDFSIKAWDFFQSPPTPAPEGENISKITRTDFILRIGLIISAIPFISILHGIIRGKYNFKVQKVSLSFDNLPEEFDGLKFVHISDLHLGSFGKDDSQVSRAVEIINRTNADYIFFTGDMVNNRALEMESFLPVLKNMQAKHGKYSILGNHDYGDHFEWPSETVRKENMTKLFSYQEEAGFRLLRNESVILERNGKKILLAGVENWGLPPFPQYGDLAQALKDREDVPFKILLSHDPSHWDAEIREQSNVDLTLSGHTHGMQFAINIPGWKWSPVKLKYPRWSGLYQEGRQLLYVNIGLGFIAFPGRVGTPPEITEFTLYTKKS
jgi:hypothetical protein